MNVHWISWCIFAFSICSVGWGVASSRTRNKSLRKVSRPYGGYAYVWRDLFGREHRSRTHPAFAQNSGASSDGGPSGYDGGGD